MIDKKKMQLWAAEEVSAVSPEMSIVRNIYTGKLMLRRISEPDSIDTMRLLCRIKNRFLMEIYDADMIGGMCVTLGEYVQGTTLADIVMHRGVFSERDAITIIASVCTGLKALHSSGIIHRDVNPNNVMLDHNGCVKIIDYDIARTVKAFQTRDTRVMGTPGYTAPEQFGFQQTDARADIYSCGALLNFLLTGKLPNELMYQGSLSGIISRCIELDPDNRYTDIDHLRAVLTNDRKYIKLMNNSEIESMRFRPLPGYRTKRFFPKLITTIAIIIYAFGLITWVGYIFSPEHHTKQSVQHILALIYFGVLVFGFFSLFPYLLFGDVGKYSLKMTKDPISRKRLNRLFGWLCIIVGIVLLFVMMYLSSKGILDV